MNVSKLEIKHDSHHRSVNFGKFVKHTSAIIFFLIGFAVVLTYFKHIGTVPESHYYTIVTYIFGMGLSIPFISLLINKRNK